MMQNMVHPHQDQLPIEELTSPLGAQIFEFCESELFPETLQNSEATSTSNGCYEEHSSNPTHLPTDMNKYNSSTGTLDNVDIVNQAATTGTAGPCTPPSVATGTCSSNLSTFLEDQIENDISASIDFTPSPSFSVPHQQYFGNSNSNQEPFSMASLNNQISSLGDAVDGSLYPAVERRPMVVSQVLGPPLPASLEEDCLPSVGQTSYMRLRNSSTSPACSGLLDPMIGPYLPTGSMSAPFSADNSGFFLGTDMSSQELEFQGGNCGLFLPDSMARVFSCSTGDLQALSSESQHLVHGSGGSSLASEISSLEDPAAFKVGKLSVEERKRKIHRYLKKRNERNFSKKIKNSCRKTLADSRPRVRGRFAKNEELGRTSAANHEDDTDEDVTLFSNATIPHDHHHKVKEEEEIEGSDIFAHISGVNSFKCNYPIQSWI
ncbi:uncharacterized protein LOC105158605 [Sesamum indicum]|uniref:Uncharacterized protein LOC105158605 n=1 Tax=Sesamum indicum TaxID=4182 RepID=A0A6I9SW73_SESIN|nr:uncharacterized protein LOC105158605 [Sesamum indicum]